ncbi:hypothetical protein ARAM_004253 [Aspergillus rambellii]|uniref:Alpha/beta hydrolase fold-3 domain-containing protein n=1 Tax=Aspergillus rambellii TaxID=308745 RepID=A0A0F8XS44_9EURO|nr:hypothetical protein ARAM_004253 [Aspergillus rambellii]
MLQRISNGVKSWSKAIHKAILVLFLTLGAVILRALVKIYNALFINLKVQPDTIQFIPTGKENDKHRIKLHIYRPKELRGPSPVLLTFCGSGFIIPGFGLDDPYCREISQQTGHVVIDVQYRLAPEHPFPTALEDAKRAIDWVIGQPDLYDPAHISIGGFSAGANLAVSIAANDYESHTFHSLIAFYPCVDAQTSPYRKKALVSGRPAVGIGSVPPALMHFFQTCYLLGGGQANDPRVSPALAAAMDRFPKNCLFVVASYDSLAKETLKLAKRLNTNDRHVRVYRAQGGGHAFDKAVQLGTEQYLMRQQAYDEVASILRRQNS